jgi:ribosomal protein S18 acetylase RimI-like enzyme
MQDSNIQIRNAGDNDMDALFGLFEQVQSIHAKAEPEFFRRPERDDFFERFFEGVMNDPEQNLVVACIGGNPVGFCQYFLGTRPKNLYQPDRRFAYIHGLAVSKEYRRRGCATALIGYVKEQAKNQDITLLGLDFWSFNNAARICFANAGFQVNQEHMWLKL